MAQASSGTAPAAAYRGLWRDRDCLVVHRSIAMLPEHCVKTNATGCRIDHVEHVFQWSPVGPGLATVAHLATGGLSRQVISATAGTMPLSIGVSAEYLAPKRRANLISGVTVGAGILVTLSALPLILIMQNSYPLLAMALGGLVGMVGIGMVVAGGVYGMSHSAIILTIVYLTNELAWFEGLIPTSWHRWPRYPRRMRGIETGTFYFSG